MNPATGRPRGEPEGARGARAGEPPAGTRAPAGADPADLAGRIAEASREQELRDPDEGLGRTGRIVNRIAEVVGVAVLGTIVAVIFANAVGRYAFNTSLIWAEELVLLLVPWLAMTGVFLSVRRGTMIRIDFFFARLPRVLRGPLGPLGHLFSAVVLTFMAGISVEFILLFGGDRALYLEVPRGYSSAALVAGGAASAIAFLVVLVRERRAAGDGGNGREPER